MIEGSSASQPGSLGSTRRTRFRVYMHRNLADDLEAAGRAELLPRVRYKFEQLALLGNIPNSKPTTGVNSGWLRAPLGAGGSSHYYLYWARNGSTRAKQLGALHDAIVVRTVAHHDETSTALVTGTAEDYQPFEFSNTLGANAQINGEPFVRSVEDVHFLTGYAGSGKTTALWRAIRERRDEKILYLTWSPLLARKAIEWLGGPDDPIGMCPPDVKVHTLAFRQFLQRLVGKDIESPNGGRPGTAASLSPAQMGPWHNNPELLKAVACGDIFGAVAANYWSNHTNHPDQTEFSDARTKEGWSEQAAKQAWWVAQQLKLAERQSEQFPEIEVARTALRDILSGSLTIPDDLADFDGIYIDETQDLTQVEMALIVEYARRVVPTHRSQSLTDFGANEHASTTRPYLRFAGDEGQTVRPSAFQWAWLSRLIKDRFDVKPEKTQLRESLRCPPKVASVIRRFDEDYRPDKDTRPEDSPSPSLHGPDGDPDAAGQVFLLAAASKDASKNAKSFFEEKSREAVVTLIDLEAETVITPTPRIGSKKATTQKSPNGKVGAEAVYWTPREIKGLEAETVVIFGLGKRLEKLKALRAGTIERHFAQAAIRLEHDRIRVALSRATSRIIVVEENAREATHSDIRGLLWGDDAPLGHDASLEHIKEVLSGIHRSDDERVEAGLDDAERLVDLDPDKAAGVLDHALTFLRERFDTQDSFIGVRYTLRDRGLRLALSVLGAKGLKPETRKRLAESCRLLASNEYGVKYLEPVIECLTKKGIAEGSRREHLNLLGAASSLPNGVFLDTTRGMLDPYRNRLLTSLREAASSKDDAGALKGDIDLWLRWLLPDIADVENEAKSLREAAVKTLLVQKHGNALDDAEQICLAIRPPSDKLLAQIYEKRECWADAARTYEKLSLYNDAIRCWRNSPDGSDTALNLAEQLNHPDAPLLRGYIAALKFASGEQLKGLTPIERGKLRRRYSDVLGTQQVGENEVAALHLARDAYRKLCGEIEAERDSLRKRISDYDDARQHFERARSNAEEAQRDYNEKLAELSNRDSALTLRENRLNSRAGYLDEREHDLEARQNSLDAREQKIYEREHAIENDDPTQLRRDNAALHALNEELKHRAKQASESLDLERQGFASLKLQLDRENRKALDLQQDCATLAEKNAALARENETLRSQVTALQSLASQSAHTPQTAATAGDVVADASNRTTSDPPSTGTNPSRDTQALSLARVAKEIPALRDKSIPRPLATATNLARLSSVLQAKKSTICEIAVHCLGGSGEEWTRRWASPLSPVQRGKLYAFFAGKEYATILSDADSSDLSRGDIDEDFADWIRDWTAPLYEAATGRVFSAETRFTLNEARMIRALLLFVRHTCSSSKTAPPTPSLALRPTPAPSPVPRTAPPAPPAPTAPSKIRHQPPQQIALEARIPNLLRADMVDRVAKARSLADLSAALEIAQQTTIDFAKAASAPSTPTMWKLVLTPSNRARLYAFLASIPFDDIRNELGKDQVPWRAVEANLPENVKRRAGALYEHAFRLKRNSDALLPRDHAWLMRALLLYAKRIQAARS